MSFVVGVTRGLRGYFAVLYDSDGPVQSGIGSYRNKADAAIEAFDWARAEGIPVDTDLDGFRKEVKK